MRTLLLPLVLCCSSCGTISKIQDAAEKLQTLANKAELETPKVQAILSNLIATVAVLGDKGRDIATAIEQTKLAVAVADKNADGKVTGLPEWAALFSGLLALVYSWVRGGSLSNMLGQLGSALKEQDTKRSATAKELHEKVAEVAQGLAASTGRTTPTGIV
jgi:hypothetical protein